MNVEAEICKLILEGPFPGTVGVTVEDDTAFYFTCRLFEAVNIMTCLFCEKLINCLFVKTELKNADNKSDSNKEDCKCGYKEIGCECNEAAGNSKINPSEEGAGIFLIAFYLYILTAELFKGLSDIFTGKSFTL